AASAGQGGRGTAGKGRTRRQGVRQSLRAVAGGGGRQPEREIRDTYRGLRGRPARHAAYRARIEQEGRQGIRQHGFRAGREDGGETIERSGRSRKGRRQAAQSGYHHTRSRKAGRGRQRRSEKRV